MWLTETVIALKKQMKFADRLAAIQDKFETGDTPREILDVLNKHVEHLIEINAADNALQIGSEAPLEGQAESDGATIRLSSLHTKDFFVLTWFRGNW
jgi:hypothetical protein